MNPKQKKWCKSLLERLPTETLESLIDTVTNRHVHTSNRSEHIDAILSFSESAESILRRKKLSRDFLYKYLAENGIVLSLQIDKNRVIKEILAYWDKTDQDSEDKPHKTRKEKLKSQKEKAIESPKVSKKVPSQDSEDKPHKTRIEKQKSKKEKEIESPKVSKKVPSHKNVVNISLSLSQNSADVDLVCETQASTSANGTFSTSVHVEQHFSSIPKTSVPAEKDTTQLLGETFTRWFFTNLNSHNPSVQENPQDFGPHHFWEDSHLQVISHTPPEPMKNSFSGPETISNRFLAFVKEEQLIFCPNINQEGIAVKSSPHGQVMVLVCGTIHRGNQCLGIFEQMFGLLRDPKLQNNWKVKVSKLKMMASTCTTIPKLTEGSLSELKAIEAV